MRCKNHFPVDVTSSVGVCASCLRERLSSVINADSWPHQLEDIRLPELIPPIVFPRSVSPYTARRNLDKPDAVDNYRIRFFSTPQVDHTATKKNKKSKFHAISNLFRSRSAKSAPSVPGFVYPRAIGRKSSPLSLFSLNEVSGNSDSDAESVSPAGFGCSPEPWKKTPSSTRVSRGRAKASGIGVCLSPLMRPTPMRHSGGAVEGVHSGEIRSTVKPHISNAGSLTSNRSRKLADFGKFNHKR